MQITDRDANATFMDLTEVLTGPLVLPEDADYDQVRQVWSGKVNKHPAALVRCATAQDVVHTVRWARSYGMPFSIRGGGHDYAGRALCDDGVVIDMSQMRAVSIDPVARTARVEGGATAGDLIGAAQQDGLATTTGTVASVGMAGLTLGGGYGPLMGKYGIAADNLISAQVVTADGNLLTASPTEHADLLWALRGGGGNFGVVVSLEYRLYPITQVLSGLLLYPLDQAGAVLGHLGEFIQTGADELTIQAGFIQMPDGTPVLFLSPTYCGPLDEGERVLAPLRAFGSPLADQVQPVEYAALIHGMDALVPKGRHYFIQTRWLADLRAETIEVLVEQAQQFSSPFSAIALHHFHGTARRVAVSETAFALRQDHLMVELIAGWEPELSEANQRHVQWAQSGSRALASYALQGGYINLLDEGEQQRVPLAFGPNYERLRALKRRYDPDDVFRSTIGHITPTGS
jgi:hypothetical protein